MHKRYHRCARKISTIIIVMLFASSLWQLAAAGWIQGKALVAQQLLHYSWQQTLSDGATSIQNESRHKPWPWADTWPVAKLIVPQQQVEQIVLAGDSGSSLAFAPGLSLAGAMPNTAGTILISGHRDTHFHFLKNIQLNDMLYLQTAEKTERYQVYNLQIVDSNNFKVQSYTDEHRLVLASCYPFDAVTSSSSLRYLVFASKHPATVLQHSSTSQHVDSPANLIDS